MKLLMCIECTDIFNLTLENKVCKCGKTSGRYTDDLNATITGPSIPIGFANSSFTEAYHRQKIENKYAKDDTCCKGQEFTALFIPEWAKSIRRVGVILNSKTPDELQTK